MPVIKRSKVKNVIRDRGPYELATGHAIRNAGLIDNYNPNPELIKLPGPSAATRRRLRILQIRARMARDSLNAGGTAPPSLDLALYLAAVSDLRLAGAVYLAFLDSIAWMDDRVDIARAKLLRRYNFRLANDKKQAQADDLENKISIEFAKLSLESDPTGRPWRTRSCSAIGREIKSRLKSRRSDTTFWRSVNQLQKLKKANK